MNEGLAHNHATADSQEPHGDFKEPPPPVGRVLGYHEAEDIAHHRNVGFCGGGVGATYTILQECTRTTMI